MASDQAGGRDTPYFLGLTEQIQGWRRGNQKLNKKIFKLENKLFGDETKMSVTHRAPMTARKGRTVCHIFLFFLPEYVIKS